MTSAPPPAVMPSPAPDFADEAARLRVLEEFHADALEDDPELQAIVNFAAHLCNVPASMVSLIDDQRQYFLARTGLEERETPRGLAFCSHVLGRSELMEVSDATSDPRFADNPLVTGAPGVRYYAGQPLVSDEGAPLGTLCVIDTQVHESELNEFQREGMAVLAQAAMRRLRARREQLVATREIAFSDNRFRALADSMPDMAFSADENGNFDYFNRRWLEFTSHATFDQEIGKQILHPDEIDEVLAKWTNSLQTGAPYEVEHRLRRIDGEWRWVLVRAVPVMDAAGRARRWFGTITDIDESHKLSESRDVLAKELSHRIKNIFAVVSGLISLQSRKAPEHKPFADQLTQTLQALGRAHEFVRPASGSTRESLSGLLEVILAPYRATDSSSRVLLGGGDSAVSPRAATPIALVFHELATNSAKYGALSVEDGTITVDISDDGETVQLAWKELGGPVPQDDGENGFGSRLVDLAVTGQLQGSWERRFEPDGLAVELSLPCAALAAP